MYCIVHCTITNRLRPLTVLHYNLAKKECLFIIVERLVTITTTIIHARREYDDRGNTTKISTTNVGVCCQARSILAKGKDDKGKIDRNNIR